MNQNVTAAGIAVGQVGTAGFIGWDRSVTLPKYICARWEPKEDITVYDLARALPYFMGARMNESDWTDLGTAQRHWKRLD